MKFTGEYRIQAPREAVWTAINDPEVLRQCIPGCEEIVRNTPTDWQARVLMKVGPVKARFNGQIRLEDLDPPASCRIVGEGSGGAAGFAQGGASVRLAEEGAATVLTYEAEAQIGGKLAQIGSRLIDSFARRYADDFFAAFSRIVGGETPHIPGGLQPIQSGAPSAEDIGATAVLAAEAPFPDAPAPNRPTPVPAPVAVQLPGPPPASRGFDTQVFTIVVLAVLLVFMTIMFALKP